MCAERTGGFGVMAYLFPGVIMAAIAATDGLSHAAMVALV